ncbi:MAG TPA: heavy metal translocating P-type ATPase [Acetobacteraceae bacterium]|nr:heavy metal translocating P-type ATPase [Acetobacteraceae bacterium]
MSAASAGSALGEARQRAILLVVALGGLGGGLAARFLGDPAWADPLFTAGIVPVLAVLLRDVVRGFREGEFGLDLTAALSMAGTLALGEELAGAIIALMFAGGEFLEAHAQRRAAREMTALLARRPTSALRHGASGIEEITIDSIAPGDQLLIPRGAVVPTDGTVQGGVAVLDESALTGEPVPVRHGAGEAVMSGTINTGEAFDLSATERAAASTYARIVRLVEAAQRSRAPMARLADRWALGFLALTLGIAGAAWEATGDAHRALAVLVVATPCPLILAVPVALIAGMSRAAGLGVLVKSGAALEAMARVRVLLMDKTGTLTSGTLRLSRIEPTAALPPEEVLRLAASLDQASVHVVAGALVAEARSRGLALETPEAVRERPGEGVIGRVGGQCIAVGGAALVGAELGRELPDRGGSSHAAQVHVAVDGMLAGLLILEDPPRADAQGTLASARAAGIRRIVLVSGDRAATAEAVGCALGVDAVIGEATPERKVEAVLAARAGGAVMMVGDGVNDAPALAAADIGVAMGARGAAASSEAADAVVLVDRLDRLAAAIHVARRARAIALQSVVAGIGLSTAGMVVAAFGYLTPVQGALVQEAIDVAVILNALRAVAPGRGEEQGERHA